jgi:hypothetical protein
MASLGSLPALAVKQPESPLDSYSKVLSLQGQLQQQKMGQVQLQQAQQAQKDQMAQTAALHEWDGKNVDDIPALVLKHQGSANAVFSTKSALLKQKEEKLQFDDKTFDLKKKQNDAMLGEFDSLKGLPDEQLHSAVASKVQDLLQSQRLDPAHAQIVQQALQNTDPQALRASLKVFENGYKLDSVQFHEAQEERKTAAAELTAKNRGGVDMAVFDALQKPPALPGTPSMPNAAQPAPQVAAPSAAAPVIGPPAPDATPTKTVLPGTPQLPGTAPLDPISAYQKLQEMKQEAKPEKQDNVEQQELNDFLKKNPGKGAMDFASKKASLAAQANAAIQNQGTVTPAGGDVSATAKRFGFSPVAFDQAAEKYWTTGQLPPAGRGGPALATNKAIMNRAAELHPEGSLAANSAEYKANADSLKKLQGNLDAVSAFENTAKKNIDLLVTQGRKIVDSGSPWINTPLRAVGQQGLGSEELSAFNAARQVAVNEVAKVTSSPGLTGQLTDSARHEIESFMPQNATLKQVVRVAEILKKEMSNRHESYQEQINDIKGRMKVTPAQGGTNKPASDPMGLFK